MTVENAIKTLIITSNLNGFSNHYVTFNPLEPSVVFLYPLKTSENLKVF